MAFKVPAPAEPVFYRAPSVRMGMLSAIPGLEGAIGDSYFYFFNLVFVIFCLRGFVLTQREFHLLFRTKGRGKFSKHRERDEGKELSGSKTSCCCLFAASCKTSPSFGACQSHTSSLSPSGHTSEIPQMLTTGAAPIWGAGGVWDSLRVTF